MKNLLLITVIFFSFNLLAASNLEMTCGTVKKVRSGRPLNRLLPSMFGLVKKYTLVVRFFDSAIYNEVHNRRSKGVHAQIRSVIPKHYRKKAHVTYSFKEKFRKTRADFQAALAKADKENQNLYACIGRVNAGLYHGAHARWSRLSLDDAIEKMRRKARKYML